MLGAQGVTSELITKHLVIIEGDAKALEDVKKVFSVEVSQVIFGIGEFDSLQYSRYLQPTC